jgi:non-heme Fe2+,alpha-ketoglutarate-dependent halogenase
MLDRGTERRTFGDRFKDACRQFGRRLAAGPAALLVFLKPFRSLYPFYPQPLREFLTHWSTEMLRVYASSLGTRAYIDQVCTVTDPPSYTPRVETAAEFRLTEADVKSFYANGFLGPFTLCPREDMIELREEIMRELGLPSAVYGFQTGRDRHLDCETVYRLARRPGLSERLAQILGPNLLLWRSQVFLKPPGSPGVAWHQASTYLMEAISRPTLFPPDMNQLFQLGAWLAFDDVDVANGCLQLIPGSHRRIRTMRLGGRGAGSFGKADITLEHEYRPGQEVSMEMKAGQFVIFTEQVIHGSPPNRSNRRRWGMAFRVVPPEVVVYGDARWHNVAYLNEQYDLAKWGAVVLRGADTAGVNRIIDPFPGLAGNGDHPPLRSRAPEPAREFAATAY